MVLYPTISPCRHDSRCRAACLSSNLFEFTMRFKFTIYIITRSPRITPLLVFFPINSTRWIIRIELWRLNGGLLAAILHLNSRIPLPCYSHHDCVIHQASRLSRLILTHNPQTSTHNPHCFSPFRSPLVFAHTISIRAMSSRHSKLIHSLPCS